MKKIIIPIFITINCFASENNHEDTFLQALEESRAHNVLLYTALEPTNQERAIANIRDALYQIKDKLLIREKHINHLCNVYRSQTRAVHKPLSDQAIQRYSEYRHELLYMMVYCSANANVIKLFQNKEFVFNEIKPHDVSIIRNDTIARIKRHQEELILHVIILKTLLEENHNYPSESDMMNMKLSILQISFLQRLVKYYETIYRSYLTQVDIVRNERYEESLKVLPSVIQNPKYSHILRKIISKQTGL